MTDLLLFRSDDAQTRATLAPSGLPACLPACHPAGDLGRATSLSEKDSTSHMCVYVFFFSSYRSTQGKKMQTTAILNRLPSSMCVVLPFRSGSRFKAGEDRLTSPNCLK